MTGVSGQASPPALGTPTRPGTRGRSRGELVFPLPAARGLLGNRIEARRTERLTATDAPGCQQPAADEAVPPDRFSCVIGARRHEAARSSEVLRNKQLIRPKQHEG